MRLEFDLLVLFISAKLVQCEKFYVISEDHKNFEDAGKFCETNYVDGRLAIITDEEKHEAVKKTVYHYAQSRYVWIELLSVVNKFIQ